MSSSFAVNTAQIREHATTVAELAERVRRATETADPSLSSNAFGLFGGFFAEFVLRTAGGCQDVLGAAAGTVDDMRTGLDNVVRTYEAIDGKHGAGFTRVVTS